jgi:adenosyl cobinamide kinase/adenosyl cobinamide phosphate guanylyltransferase
MHIVFGGAFNGKRQFVRGLLGSSEAAWSEGLPSSAAPISVIAGLEVWIKDRLAEGLDEKTIKHLVEQAISSQPSLLQIWILTDISRGIVPADPLERELRDVAGRLYQHLFLQAESVTRIWYGIPQTLKGADLNENLYKNGR